MSSLYRRKIKHLVTWVEIVLIFSDLAKNKQMANYSGIKRGEKLVNLSQQSVDRHLPLCEKIFCCIEVWIGWKEDATLERSLHLSSFLEWKSCQVPMWFQSIWTLVYQRGPIQEKVAFLQDVNTNFFPTFYIIMSI